MAEPEDLEEDLFADLYDDRTLQTLQILTSNSQVRC